MLKKHIFLTGSISRVLYLMTIYLGWISLSCSSHLYGTDGQPNAPFRGVAPSGVYIARFVTKPLVSSYLAFPPLPYLYGGISLLHYP